jgi:four helix bundle protein
MFEVRTGKTLDNGIMGITRFEDIHAWQAARDLCKIVYGLTRENKFSKDFGLVDQARRAAVSIMANIAEGFDCRSNSEFIQFLYYALRSASELQSHFYVALDQSYLTQSGFTSIYEQTGKTKSMIFRFIEYLRTHESHKRSIFAAGIVEPCLFTSNVEPRTSNNRYGKKPIQPI